MLVAELLNTKVKFEEDPENDTYTYSTKAKIGDRWIHFYAEGDPDSEWLISFTQSQHEDGFKSTFKLTGSGDELKVFAMVKDSVLALVAKHHPKTMVFAASKDDETKDKNTRGDLYARLVKRFSIPGYTAARSTNTKDHKDDFTLVKDEK